jgi:peroxin-4
MYTMYFLTPRYTLQAICRSIINLLAHPEPSSPLNCDCGIVVSFLDSHTGNLLRSGDERGYKSMARMYTRIHARFCDPKTLRE